jgi:hypothetical protein
MKKALAGVIAIAILTSAVGALGQFGQRRFGGGRFNGPTGGNCVVAGYRGDGSEDLPTPRKIDRSGFVYARLRYHPVTWWREGTREIPWHHDYPDGDTMLPALLDRLTTVHTNAEAYQIVDIGSKDMFQYPFLYLSEPGYLDLLPEDVRSLREYLDRGGFLFIDDFRGNQTDTSEYQNFVAQLHKIYPDRSMAPVSPEHPIFHIFYDIDPQNMLPPYRMWNSGEVQFLGMTDPKGRIQIMVNFNNDMSEYWQALDVGQCSLHEAGLAIEVGINYAVYALSH